MKNMSILTEILAKSPRLIKSGAVNQKQMRYLLQGNFDIFHCNPPKITDVNGRLLHYSKRSFTCQEDIEIFPNYGT